MGASLDFRSFIASSLQASAIYDILGTPSAGNHVVYAAWPQHQVQLGGGNEDASAGYIAFRIDDFVRKQDILEFKTVYVDIWSTRPTINEAVKDVTDSAFNLRLAGQNGLAASTFNITYSQLSRSTDLYEEDVKLHRKQVVYEFRLVRRPIGA